MRSSSGVVWKNSSTFFFFFFFWKIQRKFFSLFEKNERAKKQQHQQQQQQQRPHLLVRRPPHHLLHSRPVVPRPVEDHDLARRGEVLQVPLPVPLSFLRFGRLCQSDRAQSSLVQRAREPLDDAPLAGRVAAFEDDQDSEALVLDPELRWAGTVVVVV
jgi:hypothetical protein